MVQGVMTVKEAVMEVRGGVHGSEGGALLTGKAAGWRTPVAISRALAHSIPTHR